MRTGLVHLLGDNNEPDWQAPPAFDFFELGTRLIEARFPRSVARRRRAGLSESPVRLRLGLPWLPCC